MEDPLIAQIIKIIIGLMLLAYVVSTAKLFSKKEKHRDSVGASRKQSELIGRRKK